MRLLYNWVYFFKQKTAYEMRISDWSSDVCSSDLESAQCVPAVRRARAPRHAAYSRGLGPRRVRGATTAGSRRNNCRFGAQQLPVREATVRPARRPKKVPYPTDVPDPSPPPWHAASARPAAARSSTRLGLGRGV